MFWALAAGKIDTGGRRYVHELGDIESLNRRALQGELEVTAVSLHAYAYLAGRYALLAHGASFGDGYRPRIAAAGGELRRRLGAADRGAGQPARRSARGPRRDRAADRRPRRADHRVSRAQ